MWKLSNVLLTPHTAGVTADGEPRSLGMDALIDNLPRYRKGEALVQPVDKLKGY